MSRLSIYCCLNEILIHDRERLDNMQEQRLNTLVDYRKNLDRIDEEILTSLAKRQECVQKIIEVKILTNAPLRDMEREKVILDNLKLKSRRLGLNPFSIEKFFRMILSDSVRLQRIKLFQLKALLKKQDA